MKGWRDYAPGIYIFAQGNHSSVQDWVHENLFHLEKPRGKNRMGRGKLPIPSRTLLWLLNQIYLRGTSLHTEK